jgi:N-methylhydantoinase B
MSMTAQAERAELDLVTFEVLRHRLWEINDEMGLMAARMSGSPAVYDSNDFNTSILTPDGKGLFVGVYVIRQAAALDLVVQGVIDRFKDDPGIHDGDVYMTNDPWAGALHQMDVAVVAPVFWEGEIVAWTGIVMHEIDVGGPQPGSWTVGARNVYQEPPLIAPVRIVDKGVFRRDVEEWYLRNSRTPGPNGLNLRAKLSSQLRTRDRIHEIIRKYGTDVFLALQQEILEHVRTTVRQRLRALPDGVWYETGFVDHDGRDNILYPLKLAMTKQGDRLTFDFRGTSAQAPGPINCTRSGLIGGVLQIALPMLCFDTSWSPGAVLECMDIISEPGTLNNATYPAAVSMATVNACQATGNLVVQTISRMFGCCDSHANEVIATGYPGLNSAIFHGSHRDGRPFTAQITLPVGGGGARAFRDGIDSAGTMISPSYGVPTAERLESVWPLLLVYCKENGQTAGAGKFRGGAGLEFLLAPHGGQGELGTVLRSNCCSQPEAKGLFGGLPGSIERQLILRGARLNDTFGRGEIPTDWSQIECETLEVCEAKGNTTLGPNDLLLNFCSGGGGYGDPLERDPALVVRDIERGLCTLENARSQYGVVLDATGLRVEQPATDELRAETRRARLERGVKPAALRMSPLPDSRSERLMPAGQGLEVLGSDDGSQLHCARCAARLGPATADPRALGVLIEQSMDEVNPLNRFGLVDEVVIQLFCCPECGGCYSVDVRLRSNPTVPDMNLRLSS